METKKEDKGVGMKLPERKCDTCETELQLYNVKYHLWYCVNCKKYLNYASPSGQVGIEAMLTEFVEQYQSDVDNGLLDEMARWLKSRPEFSAQIPVREEKIRKTYEYAVNEGRLWIHSPVDKEGYADEMNESWERFKLSPDFGGIK